MTDKPRYHDEGGPIKAQHIAFTEDETQAIHAVAERFAQMCLASGIAPPADPMRALLAFGVACMRSMDASAAEAALHGRLTTETELH